MRVAHVITRLIVGGAQENTISSVMGLAEAPGFDPHLFSGPSIGAEGSLESCFSSRPDLLTLVPDLVRPIRPWRDLRTLRRLTEHFLTTRPAIVHTHSGKAGILGRFAAARAGVPVIVHTIHGPSFGSFQGPIPNLVLRAAERRAARVTTHFVVVSEAMRRQYLAAGIGRAQDYSTIYSGFRLAPFLSARNNQGVRAKLGLKEDDIVVGKIARLFKLKGHDTLFRIAPFLLTICPRLKFLLVGDGQWRDRFEKMARKQGFSDRFIFTGLVPPEEVPDLVGVMDIVVHLSLREGLARALPQAMAAGKPVIAWDCDGAGEVCLDGKTGFLIPPGDLMKLQGAILALATQPWLRLKYGQAGCTLAASLFDVRQMVRQLTALYSRLSAALQPQEASPGSSS